MKIAILDYGLSNLKSIENALNELRYEFSFVQSNENPTQFSNIILPGVGAFKDGMKGLIDRGLDSMLNQAVSNNIPILGICLGMQLLLTKSYEFGETNGLDLIPGEVLPFKFENEGDEFEKKVPHIGWNQIEKADVSWENTILENMNDPSMYFVHSYFCKVQNNEHLLAEANYHGQSFSAIIQCGSIIGCQFHPEKSGEIGLNLLSRCLKMEK